MSNQKLLERLYSNEKIRKLNPLVLSELSRTFIALHERVFDQFEELLEVVEFDKVVACLRFITYNGRLITTDPEDLSNVSRDVYFSRWKDENFSKYLQLSSAVSKSGRVVRYKLKDEFSRQLRSVLTRSNVRLDHRRSSKLYYTEDGQLKVLKNFSEQDFITLCMDIFARYLRLSEEDAIKIVLRHRVLPISDLQEFLNLKSKV